VKLLPLPGDDGRYEVPTRGSHVFPGYLGRDDLTRLAFDDEGYFRLGDALALVDPADLAGGLRFAGRVVEDFKLATGTWVRTGSVRLALVEQCAPLITDAVICGHDQPYVTALAWPNVAACRALAPELCELDVEALVRHPVVVEALRRRLADVAQGGAAARVERMLLMAQPPSIAANEIADKGYVNQGATRARRSALVDELFMADPPAHVARTR
jgi:feruloyl-CoA synthase